MSARKTLPIGVIVMVLMMALAALGVGYAWWTEQLSATGSIQTGSIDVKIESVNISKTDPLNVTSCTYTLSNDGKAMSIVVDNAYPAFVCIIDFNLTNHGTVPAKITKIDLPSSGAGYLVTPSGGLLGNGGLNPASPQSGKLKIEITQGAGQNRSYTFNVGVEVSQGNAP